MALAFKSAVGVPTLRARQSARRAVPTARKSVVVRAESTGTPFDGNWFKIDPLTAVAAIGGWVIPSNIGVAAFNGNSLFGMMNEQISIEMAHFPTGPGLDSPFWVYMLTWHVGLFAVMTLGQIGVQARRQGYFQ